MEYQANENAFTARSASGWVLKPVCDPGDLAADGNGFAVRTGDGSWALSPASRAHENENGLAIAAPGGEKILWPIGCPDSGNNGGDDCHGGPHPLCHYCTCYDPIRTSYTVSISGLPAICSAQVFNGVFSVAFRYDCVWWCDVDSDCRLTLQMGAGWSLSWSIVEGPSGVFRTEGGSPCRPESSVWTPSDCFEPVGCSGLRTAFLANGVCVVS
jgi:hypothetical protein